MNAVEIARTIYPRLPDIPDEDTFILVTTLETKERAFVDKNKSERSRYLRALYLKAMSYLGHSHFFPGGLPRLIRLKMTAEIGVSKDLANILKIHPMEKSRIVSDVRRFIGLKPYRRKERLSAEKYLIETVAHKEGDLLPVINAAIGWFRNNNVALPDFGRVIAISEESLNKADKNIQKHVAKILGKDGIELLDLLLVEDGFKTPLYHFKLAANSATPINMQAELKRLKSIQQHLDKIKKITDISRRKTVRFADIANKYTAAELSQLNISYQVTVLVCYLKSRYSQLLDIAAGMFIQIWKNATATAKKYANDYKDRRNEISEQHEAVFLELLEIICINPTGDELARRIFLNRTLAEYECLRKEAKKSLSWNECCHLKLQDHYSTLRWFLPDWYDVVPLIATTAEDSLIRGIEFIKKHIDPKSTNLPVSGIPTRFLSSEWMRRAIVKHKWNNQITSVNKSCYELGAVNATAASLEEGTIAIEGAGRYAPVTQHLIRREKFLRNFSKYLQRFNFPKTIKEFYTPYKQKASKRLRYFDDHYAELKKICRVNHKGTLSYLRQPSYKPPRRIEKLTDALQPYLTPITIFDLLLDCHHMTGFLDAFRPIGGRQNMTETERLLTAMATLYAYGNNCGPSQAGQATGLRKQAIVYFRRHYMGIRQLMEAAYILVDAYSYTGLSSFLRDPGVFMTDSMRMPTLENSLTAREHFRYPGGKHILLYQHVTTDCICFFTNALLCDVAEGIYMIHGAVKQQSKFDPTVNICDNAGRSDFTDGMGLMLNIEVFSQLTSRQNLKLWRVDDSSYQNINEAFSGEVSFEAMETGWVDMVWILASIATGKGDPSLIAEILRTQPNHPATKGFRELGKLHRTDYMVRYGINMNLRRYVTRHTARRETWNQFGRSVYNWQGGLVREKGLEGQTELFWFLTVVQNAIVLWNAMALEQAIRKARKDGIKIEEEDKKHILPTMIEHINFIGTFDIDMNRKSPFKLSV